MGVIYKGIGGPNPPFTIDEYFSLYPQFKDIVPQEVVDMYLRFADSCVKKALWRDGWKVGMCLFISHFLTLYLQSKTPEGSPENQVIAAGEARGLKGSNAVDRVSVWYDFTTAMQDLDGWAAFKLTTYGTQFATLAKIYGMGAAYVW